MRIVPRLPCITRATTTDWKPSIGRIRLSIAGWSCSVRLFEERLWRIRIGFNEARAGSLALRERFTSRLPTRGRTRSGMRLRNSQMPVLGCLRDVSSRGPCDHPCVQTGRPKPEVLLELGANLGRGMVLPERIELADSVRKPKQNKASDCPCSKFVYHSCGPSVQDFSGVEGHLGGLCGP